MRILRNSTKKHHLTFQEVYEVLGKAHFGTFTRAPRECWTAIPSIEDFAKLHPERTVRVSFDTHDYGDELFRLTQALQLGGYRHGIFSPLLYKEKLAKEALVYDLHVIAFEDLEIVNHDFEYEETGDEWTDEYAITATFVFRDKKDAERFKRYVKARGFRVVEDGSSLD